ncbi:MAG: gamma-glutamylcyclotransferase, partial [Candidatus Marsarchaeota archaeon]|nr:gamma-glutamylcyclotransferase [Candidatus Marsarchaeota archaeon]
MYYFAYGSNLSRARLKERVGNFSKEEKCIAEDYKLTFDDRGKADIITSVGSKVYGIIYELSTDQMNELDRYEGVKMGVYMRLPILVKVNDKPTEAVA